MCRQQRRISGNFATGFNNRPTQSVVVREAMRFTPKTDRACNRLVVGNRNPAMGEFARRRTSAVMAASDFNSSAASRKLVFSCRSSVINFAATGENGGKFRKARRLEFGFVSVDKAFPQLFLSDEATRS